MFPQSTLQAPPEWFPIAAQALFPTSSQQSPIDSPDSPHPELEALLLLDAENHPIEDTADPYDSVECPKCHYIGRQNSKAGSIKRRDVTRWECKKCSATFNNA